MKNNPPLSKKHTLKDILKVLIIAIPCTVVILLIGNYSLKLYKQYTRDKYGAEPIEYSKEIEDFKKFYNVDELIENWDGQLEGYYKANPFISLPEYYLSGEEASISEKWILKDGYTLELYCPEKVLSEVIEAEYYTCSIMYNNELISDTVRYYIQSPDNDKSVRAEISMVVYSQEESNDNYEYLILGSYLTGSKDEISFYSLRDGEALEIPFEYNGQLRERWEVEYPLGVSLYYDSKGDHKIVTQLHDPTMPGKGIFRIWSFEGIGLLLDKTIGDISE